MITWRDFDNLREAAQWQLQDWLTDFSEAFEARPRREPPLELSEQTMQALMETMTQEAPDGIRQ